MSVKKDTPDSRIEALLTSEKPLAATVKAAAEKLAVEKSKQQEKKLLNQMRNADEYVQSFVRNLRNKRAAERKAHADLKTINTAYEQFLETGDYEAFAKVANLM